MPWPSVGCVAAAVVVASATGDLFVPVALLGLAVGPWAGVASALAAAATVARWGTAELGALAGDQDVLGPAVATGPTGAAVSSGLAAAAVVLGVAGAPGGRALPAALAAGVTAGALACGPAATSASSAGQRVGAAVGGVVVAWLLTRLPVPVWAGAFLGVVAVVVAVLAT